MDGLCWTILALLASLSQLVITLKLSNVTEDLNLLNVSGRIGAIADFNSDKANDILVLNDTGYVQSLYLWNKKRFDLHPLPLDVPSPVVTLRVGDFDGDGVVDIISLVRVATSDDDDDDGECRFMATVHWMTLKNGSPEISDTLFLFNTTSSSLLMTLDVNGDHLSDILATSCEDPMQLSVWISRDSKIFDHELIDGRMGGGGGGGDSDGGGGDSSYYLDLSSDCLPELVVLRGREEDQKWLEVWTRKEDQFILQPSILLPFDREVILSPLSFIDMDGNGVKELVMLACHEVDTTRQLCLQTSIHVLYQSKFSGNQVINCRGSDNWELEIGKNVSINLTRGLAVPMETVTGYPVIGDLDLNSNPDMVIPVTNVTSNDTRMYLFILQGSADGSLLLPQWDSVKKIPLDDARKVILFDLWEDGILDILVDQTRRDGGRSLSAHKQSLSADHTFLKVLVLSGHCYTNCRSGNIPYGSVLPSASVAYSTTDRNSHTQLAVASTKSSSDPFQLPFVLFGLGETPNFIEQLTIATVVKKPSSTNHSRIETVHVEFHKWRNLVPNSQVIVIPIPPDNSGRWRLELYLTPSHLMYTTAGALCAVAVAMAIMIILLHAREKYQDHQERKQAKHKFHFNAM